MLRYLFSFALAATLVTLSTDALSASMQDHDDDQPVRKISVTGEGTSYAVPDTATIQSGVVTQSKTAKEALQANSAAVVKMLDELKNMGIDEKDLQTSRFNVNPVYDRGPRGQEEPKVTGYRVTNQVAVKVRDISQLGTLLDKVVDAGGNQISGIQFELDDENAVINQARVNAVKDARARADLYAAAAGVKVGNVISISEVSFNQPQPMYRLGVMESRAGSVPVEAGQQAFTASVRVEFELIGG